VENNDIQIQYTVKNIIYQHITLNIIDINSLERGWEIKATADTSRSFLVSHRKWDQNVESTVGFRGTV